MRNIKHLIWEHNWDKVRLRYFRDIIDTKVNERTRTLVWFPIVEYFSAQKSFLKDDVISDMKNYGN